MDNQMEVQTPNYPLQMLTLILSESQCNKCVRLAKEKGIRGVMVTIGRGTVDSSILNLLGVKSQKKEIAKFLLNKPKAEEMLIYFTEKLHLNEPGRGIAFTSPVLYAAGLSASNIVRETTRSTTQNMEENSMFKKITVIVDRGMAEDVMNIARSTGVRGGTILHGRGAGAEIATKLFGVEIEPEKELLLILTPDNLVEKVVHELHRELQLDEPGKGILFVEPILESRGLFEMNHKNK